MGRNSAAPSRLQDITSAAFGAGDTHIPGAISPQPVRVSWGRRCRTWGDPKGVYQLVLRTDLFTDEAQQAALEEQAAVLGTVRGAPHVVGVHRHALGPRAQEPPGAAKRGGGVLRVVTECAPAAPGSSCCCGRRLHCPLTCSTSVDDDNDSAGVLTGCDLLRGSSHQGSRISAGIHDKSSLLLRCFPAILIPCGQCQDLPSKRTWCPGPGWSTAEAALDTLCGASWRCGGLSRRLQGTVALQDSIANIACATDNPSVYQDMAKQVRFQLNRPAEQQLMYVMSWRCNLPLPPPPPPPPPTRLADDVIILHRYVGKSCHCQHTAVLPDRQLVCRPRCPPGASQPTLQQWADR